MTRREDEAAVRPVLDVRTKLGVAHHIGGSVASSVHGFARSTIDIDIVAGLDEAHVEPLLHVRASGYYADGEAIRAAIRSRSSFNLIRLDTMMKVDIFVMKRRAFDQAARSRVTDAAPFGAGSAPTRIASAEDIILNKLDWYRAGNEIAERQWLDVIGVMKVQGTALDRAYLARWAAELGLEDLLSRAWKAVGDDT